MAQRWGHFQGVSCGYPGGRWFELWWVENTEDNEVEDQYRIVDGHECLPVSREEGAVGPHWFSHFNA